MEMSKILIETCGQVVVMYSGIIIALFFICFIIFSIIHVCLFKKFLFHILENKYYLISRNKKIERGN